MIRPLLVLLLLSAASTAGSVVAEPQTERPRVSDAPPAAGHDTNRADRARSMAPAWLLLGALGLLWLRSTWQRDD